MSRYFGMSRRRMLDGGTNTSGGSHNVGTQYNPHAENIPSPAPFTLPGPVNLAPLWASFYSGVALLKARDLLHALRDVLLALGVLFLLLIVLGAIPLGIGMMLFIEF